MNGQIAPTVPCIKVHDAGWPYRAVTMADLWNFIVEAGYFPSSLIQFSKFLLIRNYTHSNPNISFRFFPYCPFGKAILTSVRKSTNYTIHLCINFIISTIGFQKDYYHRKRIIPKLIRKPTHPIGFHIPSLTRCNLLPSLTSTSSLTSIPRIRATYLGKSHYHVLMADIWNFFLDAGLQDDDTPVPILAPHIHNMHSYIFSHPYVGFRFNTSTPFGKSILRNVTNDTYYSLFLCIQFVYFTIGFHKDYKHPKRIRSHLLSPKHHPILKRFHKPISLHPYIPSLHKLIRNRSRPLTPLSPTLSPTVHRNKSSFKTIPTHNSPPLRYWKPQDTLFGSRFRAFFPREGVG